MTRRTRLSCLTLLGFAACTSQPPTLLADVSKLDVRIAAGPYAVFANLDNFTPEGCLVLDESFRATVNGEEMEISHRGSGSTDFSCGAPRLTLRSPPNAERSTLELSDASMKIGVDLADLLAPRSIQISPDGPWIFEAGTTVTARYTPAADLRATGTRLELRTAQSGWAGTIQFTASDDQLSFVVPDRPGSWLLGVQPSSQTRPWPCQNATCWMNRLATIAQPIEIRRPATM
jgi:hypothetical protein